MQNHLINIPFNNITAKHNIFNKFDYEVDEKLYLSLNKDGIPDIYNHIYKYVLSLSKNVRPIIFSSDYSISSATCCAMSEKYMEQIEMDGHNKYLSSLKIVYFTSTVHLNKLSNMSALDFSKSILSNIFDENDLSYTNHNFIPSPEQFYLIGLDDNTIDKLDIEKLELLKIKYFSLSKLKKKKIENVLEFITDEINNDPVYIIYDMSVLSFDSAPCVFRINQVKKIEDINGLSSNEIEIFLEGLSKSNIVGIDITGFNLKETSPDISFKITSQNAKLPLINLLRIKEKKINIFNETTKIIICKPIDTKYKWNINTIDIDNKKKKKEIINKIKKTLDNEDENISLDENFIFENINHNHDNIDPDVKPDKLTDETSNDSSDDELDDELDDIGWYIMRNIPNDSKEELINFINGFENKITSYKIDDNTMYISYTTINEQQNKSYYNSTSILDRVLTPGEKVNLLFSQL
jgi:arginase family enzyme